MGIQSSKKLNEEELKCLAIDWNVSFDLLIKAHKQSSNILEIFCIAKKMQESKFQKLYFEASEELFNKTGTGLPNPPRLTKFSFTKWWMYNNHEIAKSAQETLSQLLKPNTIVMTEIPFDMSFAKFLHQNPAWNDEKESFVFFRDHPCVTTKYGILIQRKQLSGNCFIHAPIVAHYYAMCMRYPEAKPVDIRAYILRHLDSEHLAKLITRCGGGSSRHIFNNLIGESATLLITGFNVYQNDILENLKLYGIGLVTGFQIERKFQKSESCSHQGKFSTDIIGNHAMVLIGYRIDETGKQFVLLQNWWEKLQFVECDAEYFAASGATIYFCKGDISEHDFMTTSAVYDEGNYDCDDNCPEEMSL
jgi:hypothetical protein